MKYKILGKSALVSLLAFVFMAGGFMLSCGGANPAFAPFGSEIQILQPPPDIVIPPNSLEPVRVCR